MSEQMDQLLGEYRKAVESISDMHIKKILLYGSYARGDFNIDSDIDIMILVDLDESHMKPYEDRIYDITYDFNCKYGMDIMPVILNIDHYNYWKKAYMFYKNVEEEGVAI
mgnify:CR=1 FL=1